MYKLIQRKIFCGPKEAGRLSSPSRTGSGGCVRDILFIKAIIPQYRVKQNDRNKDDTVMSIGLKLTGGVLLAAAVMVACTTETPFEVRTGQAVSFGVTTGFDNGPETRTEYRGTLVTSGESRYERINWVPGTDRIRILCDDANDVKMADYKILSASVGEDARNSSGTVEPAGSDKLTWGLSGDHYFFALYPAAAMSGVTASEAVLEKHAT